MKKHYYVFIALLFSHLYANAQPSLVSSNIMPFGTVVTSHMAVDASPIDTTIKGANAVWDFSGLQSTTSTLVYTVMDPTQTTQGSNFPTSNWCRKEVESGATSYRYFKLTSSTFERVGSYSTSVNTYSDSQIEYVFPMTLGTSSMDTWDNTNSSFGGTYNFICIGYGTLTTPSGTYNDVLMVKIEADEVIVTYDMYIWYSTSGVELLSYLVGDGFFFDDQITYVTSISSVATGVVFSTDFTQQLSIVNPVKDDLKFNFGDFQPENFSYTISNMIGETVKSGAIETSGNSGNIPCEELKTGIYFISLQDKDGNKGMPIKFVKN
ncbi:MAG TPA: T9SS type A sorting domain-containing protein [Cytophagaceae bacterium]|jgi:hypothetical protein|nr:T9SS type A sorting domain-containing protein [Cytophagaceae bacterium]